MTQATERTATCIARTGLLVALGLMATAARAEETYGVVALVGQEIAVTFYQPSVGSSLDRNFQNHIKLPDDHFDRLAARVASEAIRTGVPDATTRIVAIDDREGFGDVGDPAATDDSLQALVAAARKQIGPADTHYLLVIGKYRADARLRVRDGFVGSGKLSGLGFFVDANKRMRKTSTGERGLGYVAPYAYLIVTLVDLRTGAVVRSESAMESTTRANVRPDAGLDPWTAISAEEKVRILDNLVRIALQRVVPQVVAPH